MKMFRKTKKGFTLIELMIVISIIGVLAAIAIPNFRQAREKSNTRACYANQKTILGALEMYNLDNGTALLLSGETELKVLVDNKYMQSIPKDPGCASKGGNNYKSNESGDVWCEFHGTIDGTCLGTCGGKEGNTGEGAC